jgi:hypothetical protein
MNRRVDFSVRSQHLSADICGSDAQGKFPALILTILHIIAIGLMVDLIAVGA